MRFLHKTELVCLDVESTGLSVETDRIIEVGAVRFCQEQVLDEFETLINPECLIPKESQLIHNISDEMVAGKPLMKEILPQLHAFIGDRVIMGHGIKYDIDMLNMEAQRAGLDLTFGAYGTIDSLRLARLYGQSPSNSLTILRQHFNIEAEGAHRALSDVLVNCQVFVRLTKEFRSIEQIEQTLKRPIQMKNMPLGKHKGRPMRELPIEYLRWASHQEFDQDLLFSIRTELQRRKKGNDFAQVANPFASL